MRSKLILLISILILFSALLGVKLIYSIRENPVTTSAETTNHPASNPTQPTTPGKTTVEPETIQSTQHASANATVSKPESLKITAVGDVLLGRGVEYRLKEQKKDYTYPFERVSGILQGGDIIFGNLEASITPSTHGLAGIDVKGGKYVLKADPAAFEGIKYAGFNIMNLANNHILDYYDKGLLDTIELFDKNGISHIGAGKNLDAARKPVILEKKGMKIGFLSYTEMANMVYKGNPPVKFAADSSKAGVSPLDIDYIKEDIGKLKGSADIIIISLHWGVEYTPDLYPGQSELAHKIIDEGADAIIGHHPHHMKGIEIYKEKPILYSLGNFISDQNDPNNQQGFIASLEYSGKKLTGLSAVPFKIYNKSQVVPVTGSDAADILKKEYDWSRALNTVCEIKDDKLVFNLR